MELTYKMIEDNQSVMETNRKDSEKTKQLCVDLTYPERLASWEWSSMTYGLHSEKKQTNIIKRVNDGTARYAFSVWRNGLMSRFFPKQLNWFKEYYSSLKFRDNKNVIKWLQNTDDYMIDVINRSGSVGCDNDYYNQKQWSISDCGCIGDSFMFIRRDKRSGKQEFMAAHPKDCWLMRDFWGRVTAIHYKMTYTYEQVVDEFGMNALSDNQRMQYTSVVNAKNEPITIIYACYRNKDSSNRPGTMNMAYQTGYFNLSGQKKISQSGSGTINPIPYSMRRQPGENYGLGLVYSNIIECLTVDEIGRTMMMAGQQSVQPSMLVSSAIMNKLNLRPGAVNKVDSMSMQGLKMGDLLTRIVDSSGYPFGADQQRMWQDMINKRFGVNLFVALSSQDTTGRTAFEVSRIEAEQAVLMGPQISEISTMTDMEFDRIYQLELDSGNAPEPPMEVLTDSGGRIDLSYVGPLNHIIKQYYESGSLMTTVAYLQEALITVPHSAIVIEGDELIRKIMRSGNCPEDLVLSKAEVQELRAISAQMMEEERQAKMMGEASKIVPNLAKRIEQNSVLGQAA